MIIRRKQYHGRDGEVLCLIRRRGRQSQELGGSGEDADGVFSYFGEVEEERVGREGYGKLEVIGRRESENIKIFDICFVGS